LVILKKLPCLCTLTLRAKNGAKQRYNQRGDQRHSAARTVERDDPVAVLVCLGHNRVRFSSHLRLCLRHVVRLQYASQLLPRQETKHHRTGGIGSNQGEGITPYPGGIQQRDHRMSFAAGFRPRDSWELQVEDVVYLERRISSSAYRTVRYNNSCVADTENVLLYG